MSGDLFWLLLVGLTDCCFSAEPPQPPAASTRLSPHSRPAAARPGRWCRPAQPSPAQPRAFSVFVWPSAAAACLNLTLPPPPRHHHTLLPDHCGRQCAEVGVEPGPGPPHPELRVLAPLDPGPVWPQLVVVAAAVVAILPPPAPAWSPPSPPAWAPGTPLYSDSDL